VKTFDEWFEGAYKTTFDEYVIVMSMAQVMHAMTRALRDYATYAAMYSRNEK
jgi:hypothetical protein